MVRRVWAPFFAGLFVLAVTAAGWTQTSYEDPQGRFAIDIPKGWQLAPQTDNSVFIFQGEGKSIIIECVAEVNDPARLLKKAETTVRAAGMAKPVLDGQVMEMTMNGLPARWAAYRSAPEGAILAALCGGVGIGENGLYFLSIIPAADVPAWMGKLEKAFQTIRGSGQKITGVEGFKAAAVAAGPVGKPTPWSSKLASLTLPPGWTESPRPRGIEKEVQGIFANPDLPGATLMVICYRGIGMSMPKALDAGIKTFKIPVPNAQPVDAREMEVEGRKVNFVVYKGTSVGSGTEVELVAVIAVTKADRSYTNLIAIGQATMLTELEPQILEIAKTVK